MRGLRLLAVGCAAPSLSSTGAEGAERALSREQPVAADAATPTPVNNESAGAEGAEFIAQDLSQDPPGNDDLLLAALAAARATEQPRNKWRGHTSSRIAKLPSAPRRRARLLVVLSYAGKDGDFLPELL